MCVCACVCVCVRVRVCVCVRGATVRIIYICMYTCVWTLVYERDVPTLVGGGGWRWRWWLVLTTSRQK